MKTMKYFLMAMAAGTMIACNEGRDDNRMETAPGEDRGARERTYETPEMSGDRDQMRQPVDEVNPPEDMVPFNHEIHDDSLIAPANGNTGSSKHFEGEVGNDRATRGGAVQTRNELDGQPVMPEGGTTHHSAGNVENVEGTVPASHDVHDDGTIAPEQEQGNMQQQEPGTGTTYTPISPDGVHQPHGAQHMSQDARPEESQEDTLMQQEEHEDIEMQDQGSDEMPDEQQP